MASMRLVIMARRKRVSRRAPDGGGEAGASAGSRSLPLAAGWGGSGGSKLPFSADVSRECLPDQGTGGRQGDFGGLEFGDGSQMGSQVGQADAGVPQPDPVAAVQQQGPAGRIGGRSLIAGLPPPGGDVLAFLAFDLDGPAGDGDAVGATLAGLREVAGNDGAQLVGEQAEHFALRGLTFAALHGAHSSSSSGRSLTIVKTISG